MSSKHDPSECLDDILENIGRIERYIAGLDQNQFEEDERTRDAVERCLERICEASVRLGDAASRLIPEQPWGDIRGMGNRFRHAYDHVDTPTVWDTVTEDLPGMKVSAQRALAALRR